MTTENRAGRLEVGDAEGALEVEVGAMRHVSAANGSGSFLGRSERLPWQARPTDTETTLEPYREEGSRLRWSVNGSQHLETSP